MAEEEATLNCAICCHGQTCPGMTTVTLQRGGTTVILKDVPADVCDNCGEYYLTAEITEQVMELADRAARSGNEVEILAFAA